MNDVTIILILLGCFVFVLITFGITLLILWNRRKWIYTNFLSEDGKWERKHWKKLDKEVDYDGIIYEFDIKKCTRDNVNRPIAHYYKGNPKQQIFHYDKGQKSIDIGTEEIKPKDFRQILLTKIIKDLFSDDEWKTWFIIILIVMVIGFIITIFTGMNSSSECVLMPDNQTINTIATGVKYAIENTV